MCQTSWFQTFRDFHLHQDEFAHLQGISQRDAKLSSSWWRWWWGSTSALEELELWCWRSIVWIRCWNDQICSLLFHVNLLDSSLTTTICQNTTFLSREDSSLLYYFVTFVVSFSSTLKLTSVAIFFSMTYCIVVVVCKLMNKLKKKTTGPKTGGFTTEDHCVHFQDGQKTHCFHPSWSENLFPSLQAQRRSRAGWFWGEAEDSCS